MLFPLYDGLFIESASWIIVSCLYNFIFVTSVSRVMLVSLFNKCFIIGPFWYLNVNIMLICGYICVLIERALNIDRYIWNGQYWAAMYSMPDQFLLTGNINWIHRYVNFDY